MSDIIQLLPDSVANQIAAGEVVQRPASAIKELMENSVDAGSNQIQVIVKDGGKALIQVIDNGCGMSETDARLSFERHATSKIREAADLFSVRTMGFRGEALASISAIAEVELRTRRHEDEVGVYIRINGSQLEDHKSVACPVGSNFSVKNLFFNVPARRKFLKSSSLELKHIIAEFQRVALANPDIAMSLNHNGADVYNLPVSAIKQRIVGLFGRNMNQQLLDCTTNTTVANISGFIGRPESARKSAGEQFFFVNNRYFKSPYLHRAVVNSYDRLLSADSIPPYFIYLEVDPNTIDVNIHPTKTEIKFEDERTLWQIVHAVVKESLGKFSVAPSIDFETQQVIDIPFFPKSAPVNLPEIDINSAFNPFDDEGDSFTGRGSSPHRQSAKGWQQLYQDNQGKDFETSMPMTQTFRSKGFDDSDEVTASRFFQFKDRYILTSVKSGLMVIDQKYAHERILYEQYLGNLSSGQCVVQKELFPQAIELNAGDYNLLMQSHEDLSTLGIEVSSLGHSSISINSLPANLKISDPIKLIEDILVSLKEEQTKPLDDAHQKLAASMAKAASIGYIRALSTIEMQDLVDKLFACQHPNLSPDGKVILTIISLDELEKRFK
ncbi:MAG: DNA mismatch repair endonuclease MutL [Bacteroidales bacterium]|nr:MAG: DNA mismatch repair endonuclease MutL [Bacteroidales bacterium]